MTLSPFLLLKRSTIAALRARADEALLEWAAAWAPLPDNSLTCVAATSREFLQAAAVSWHARSLNDGLSAWVNTQTGIERSIEQILFGLDENDSRGDMRLRSAIASEVAADALEDLLASLTHALTGQASRSEEPAPLPERLFRAGSGGVLLTLTFAGNTIRLLLPGETIAAQFTAGSTPMPLRAASTLHQALAGVQVRLSVELGRTEVPLGELRTLAVGDVLALPTSVEHALRVAGPGNSTVCHAHLGSFKGALAVEVVRQHQ